MLGCAASERKYSLLSARWLIWPEKVLYGSSVAVPAPLPGVYLPPSEWVDPVLAAGVEVRQLDLGVLVQRGARAAVRLGLGRHRVACLDPVALGLVHGIVALEVGRYGVRVLTHRLHLDGGEHVSHDDVALRPEFVVLDLAHLHGGASVTGLSSGPGL